MSGDVQIFFMILGTVFVCCQVVATIIACRTCNRTCCMLDKQMKAMENDGY